MYTTNVQTVNKNNVYFELHKKNDKCMNLSFSNIQKKTTVYFIFFM
jgi:ribosome maturation factor RimP